MMISPRLASVLLIVLTPISVAVAQASVSYATVYDYGTASNPCYSQVGSLGSSSAACAAPITGGYVDALTASNNGMRTLSSTITLSQTDPLNILTSLSNTRSLQVNSILLSGTSGASDRLVFHFLTSHTFEYQSAVQGVGGASSIFIDAPGDNAYDYREEPIGSNWSSNSQNATVTANGLDLSVAFGGFSGIYTYDAALDQSAWLYGSSVPDEYVTSTWNAQLSGIDAVDANGNVISSAVFDVDGNAALDVTSIPEPSSLMLVLSGLTALGGVTRRRMRKTRQET